MKRRIVCFALCCITLFVASVIPVLAGSASGGFGPANNCNATLAISAVVSNAYTYGPYSDKTTVLYVYDTSGGYINSSSGTNHASLTRGLTSFGSAYSVHWCGDYSRTLSASA